MQANLQGPENLMHCDNCINWEGDLVRPGCGVETLLDVIGRDRTLLDVIGRHRGVSRSSFHP